MWPASVWQRTGWIIGKRRTGTSADATSGRRRRILLIVDDCQSGDALRVSGYLGAIRQTYSTAEITLLVSEVAASVVSGTDIADHVIASRLYYPAVSSEAVILPRRLAKLIETIRVLARVGVGYDIVLTFWWGTGLLHMIGRIAGWNGRRVGYAREYPALLTSQFGNFDMEDDHLRQTEALVGAIGVQLPQPPAPRLQWTTDNQLTIEQQLREQGVSDDAEIFVCHAGSDWACQQWVPERWATLADALIETYHVHPVFTGIAQEHDYIERVRGAMRHASISLAGQTTVAELAALLARSSLCICVDSVIFELAQATGTPAVVLAGPSKPQYVPPGKVLPVIVTRMAPGDVKAINECRLPKYASGGCLDYTCPLSQLRTVTVNDVLAAVECERGMVEALAAVPASTSVTRATV